MATGSSACDEAFPHSLGAKFSTYTEMARQKSPKNSQCPLCKRFFTAKGVKEHQRHVKCSPKSKASPRTCQRARCKYCNRSFQSANSLRVHVAGQHPNEYAKSPHSVKQHRSPIQRKAKTSGEKQGAPQEK